MRCPRSPANTIPALMPPPPPNGARGAAHVTRGAAAARPGPYLHHELPPLRSSRSAPPAPLPAPSRAARAGRGGHGAASRPLWGRARGAARSPRHVTPPLPLPAAGTMAARAPRVRGRAALKGAGAGRSRDRAGRSRDRGGHPNQAHTHTAPAVGKINFIPLSPVYDRCAAQPRQRYSHSPASDWGCPGTAAPPLVLVVGFSSLPLKRKRSRN